MIAIIALSLSTLVVLSGMYLLSKSKKDSLGSAYSYASYSAIIIGSLLFAGTIFTGIHHMSRSHHGGHHMMYKQMGHHGMAMHHGGGKMCCKKMECSSARCEGSRHRMDHGHGHDKMHGEHHGTKKKRRQWRKKGKDGETDVNVEIIEEVVEE